MGKEKEDRTKLENQQKQDTQVPTKLQMYLWFFPKKCRRTGETPPLYNLLHVFVCEKNREGKSKLKMKGGGKRNQINARIYAPEMGIEK